jgi:hypothetical protein
VLAIDTALSPGADATADRPRSLTAPDAADVAFGSSFMLAADVEAIGDFVNEPWVDEWLAEVWREARAPAAPPPGRRRSPSPGRRLDHLAHYLTLLALVAGARLVPRLTLVSPSPRDGLRSAAVDLVLDIGASRTAAFIAETPPEGGRFVIGSLEVRDLGRPWRRARGIFPSRVEFHRASLGRDVYSRWSGRTNAFSWPSLVRTGGEAARLAAAQPASDALTGLASPLPYVWDDRPARGLWRFSDAPATARRRQPLVSGPLLAHLTELGDVLPGDVTGSATQPATKPRFARAALLTFAGAELVLHAVSQANSISWRHDQVESEHPRTLARIVVTLPPTVEPAEARRVEARLEAAIDLVWQAQGWLAPDSPHVPPRPRVVLGPDTASAAQLAFLENEIAHKLAGKARAYFDLAARGRPARSGTRGLRIATLDLGAGSTGLAVRAWRLDEAGAIVTESLLAEGFRAGGDDVARTLAEHVLVPAIARQLTDAGAADATRLLRSILGADTAGATTRQEELRRRFAAEIALPVSIALLEHACVQRSGRNGGPAPCTIAALLREPSPGALSLAEEIEALAADEGADGFELLATTLPVDAATIAAVTRRILDPVLAAAARAIANLGSDVVLLTGWLGRLPVVRDALLESVPLRPDRILDMTAYRVGAWYPMRQPSGSIADAKSMAAVGAVLATRPDARIGGQRIAAAADFAGRSPARAFVGSLDVTGRVPADAVLFEIEPGQPGREPTPRPQKATLTGAPPFVLAVRRAPLDTWPALPMFRLELADLAPDARPRLPLRVTLAWQAAAGDGGLGQPSVLRAIDADGVDLGPGEIEVRLATLGAEQGHWLDTGALHIDEPAVER